MVVGQLVIEDCSVPEKARLGTVVKSTKFSLGSHSIWERTIKEQAERHARYRAELDAEMGPFDLAQADVIRPGRVVSVLWQGAPSKLTIHVFYDGVPHSLMNFFGSNSISAVQ